MPLSSRFWRWFGKCPDEQWLAAYVDGQLLGREKQRLQLHLAKCSSCRDAVGFLVRAARSAAPTQVPGDYLAAAINVSPTPARRPARAWIAAAGATAVIIVAGGVLFLRTAPESEMHVSPSVPKSPAVATLEKPSTPPVSPGGEQSVLRGSRSRAIAMLSPSLPNATLAGPDIHFDWQAVAGATSYDIRVTRDTGDPAWEAHVEANHAKLPESVHLASGSKYFVWVRAYLKDGSTVESEAVPFFASRGPR